MTTACHILVDGNPALLYASRNGAPNKVLRILRRFLNTFIQERETSGEHDDTPECLLAQIVVRFGFEICEDDFSNLKVGLKYYPNVEYLYQVQSDCSIRVWQPTAAYQADPSVGLQGCQDVTHLMEHPEKA